MREFRAGGILDDKLPYSRSVIGAGKLLNQPEALGDREYCGILTNLMEYFRTFWWIIALGRMLQLAISIT